MTYKKKKKNKSQEILDEKSRLEDQIEMWNEDIRNNDVMLQRVKTSKVSDDVRSRSGGIEDKIATLLDERARIEEEIFFATKRVNKINKALEIMKVKYQAEYIVFELRHINRESLRFVGRARGYSEPAALNKIKEAEVIFEKLVSY